MNSKLFTAAVKKEITKQVKARGANETTVRNAVRIQFPSVGVADFADFIQAQFANKNNA